MQANTPEQLRQLHSEFLRLEQTQVVFQQLRIYRLRLLEQAENLAHCSEDNKNLVISKLNQAQTAKKILDTLEDTEKFLKWNKD